MREDTRSSWGLTTEGWLGEFLLSCAERGREGVSVMGGEIGVRELGELAYGGDVTLRPGVTGDIPLRFDSYISLSRSRENSMYVEEVSPIPVDVDGRLLLGGNGG